MLHSGVPQSMERPRKESMSAVKRFELCNISVTDKDPLGEGVFVVCHDGVHPFVAPSFFSATRSPC